MTPRVKANNHIGDWNTFRVVMKVEYLRVTLNDKLVIKNALLPGVPCKGSLAFQLHSVRKDGDRVGWRKVIAVFGFDSTAHLCP